MRGWQEKKSEEEPVSALACDFRGIAAERITLCFVFRHYSRFTDPLDPLSLVESPSDRRRLSRHLRSLPSFLSAEDRLLGSLD
jgi:hypothetical protein